MSGEQQQIPALTPEEQYQIDCANIDTTKEGWAFDLMLAREKYEAAVEARR